VLVYLHLLWGCEDHIVLDSQSKERENEDVLLRKAIH